MSAQAPAANQSKAQRAYEWLRERISTNEYTPGYRLVLSAIAAQLEMSVVPVREAIRQLEAEGLVTFERNVGARVSMVDAAQYSASMECLGILEGAATAAALPLITTADLERARGLNQDMAASLAQLDPHEFTQSNRDFHRLLFARCPNPRLSELVSAEWERMGYLRDSTFAFVPERARESVAEHEAILDLIARAAPAAQVEAAVREHRTNTLRSYLGRGHEQTTTDTFIHP